MREQHSLSELVSDRLPTLLKQQQQLESLQRVAGQVDGEIVGTGQEDFTQNNVVYHFTHQGKSFQLIDVPGIEGNEKKYEVMVQAAIAKAHLVFYVNGTNKKPEQNTAQKIKHYLNRDAKVYAICNLRGKGDTYEFERDRESLEQTHKDAAAMRDQTQEVLEDMLGTELVSGCQTLQGLLGFASVAFDQRGLTSIHPSRTDLLKSQRTYLQDFTSQQAMRSFSQLDQLQDAIGNSCANFEVDIVESNKRKVLRLLQDTVNDLQKQRDEHQTFSEKIGAEVQECQDVIRKSFEELKSSFTSKRNSALDRFFNELNSAARDAVEEHFSDKDDVERVIQQHVSEGQDRLAERLETNQQQLLEDLTQAIERALKRLQENAKRVSFQQQLSEAANNSLSLSSAMDAISFNFSDVGSFLLSVGGYALSGFGIGTVFPGIGNIVGAIVGGVFGLLAAGLSYFFGGRGKKIAEAQEQVAKAIQTEREKVTKTFATDTKGMLAKISEQIEDSVLRQLKDERRKMADVTALFDEKIASIQALKQQVEAKSHGTI
ncbi:dynamin family protein [Pseudomonas cichorii]|nr:GTPase [Pseudomonas cichorii]MBX8541236.1 dynamin family protein [Pseudomonas cichorii]MBX8546501.1 dynamin family protein [Pseudomonas cichorii]MBX8557243.1 dynamin family protein [Pseudomonas cichorii]MBX8561274.1 dynamin family protein [Pseudomonas cichorii]MBX8581013.1 dynamin family protein [Pseudomonas cichorii]